MRTLQIWVALLGLTLGTASAVACDEACAPGFVFEDAQGTCVRAPTS